MANPMILASADSCGPDGGKLRGRPCCAAYGKAALGQRCGSCETAELRRYAKGSRADHKEGRHGLAGGWIGQEARFLAAPSPCASGLQGPDIHKQTLDFAALRFLRRGREGGEARGAPGGHLIIR